MALTRTQRVLQQAGLLKMRARIRRRDVDSYIAQGYDARNEELQARLRMARTEEERAAIIAGCGG